MNSDKVWITTELLDLLVNQLTQQPWREVTPIFERLGQELSAQEESPTIITEKKNGR